MQFQRDLTSPEAPCSPADSGRWRTTPSTAALADALAADLRERGLQVTRDQDERYDDHFNEHLYDLIDVAGVGTVNVLDGCGVIVARALLGTEPQVFWSAAMCVLAATERVCGWTAEDRQSLIAEAAFVSVAEDGTIVRPAELTQDELALAVAGLLRAIPPDYQLARDGHGHLLAASRDRLRQAIPATAPACDLGVLVTPGMCSVGRMDDGPAAEVPENLRDAVTEEGFRLYEEIGDDRTGRITGLRIHHHGDGDCEIEPIFDRLIWGSDEHLPDRPPFWWKSVVIPMTRRDPQWQPTWLPQVLTVLRRAGLDV